MDSTSPSLSRRTFAAAVLCALLAIAASLYARTTSAQYQATHEASSCVISPEWDCDAVQNSKYAYFLGVPVASWGIAGHLLLLALLLRARKTGGTALVVAGGLAGIFALVSFAFFYVATFVIKSGCIVCLSIQFMDYALAAVLFRPALRAASVPFDRKILRFAATAGAVALAVVLPADDWVTQRSTIARLVNRTERPSIWIDPSDALIYGDPATPHQVVLFVDFACPYCNECYQKARRISERYGDQVHFVFKHFPFDMACNPRSNTDEHRGACEAARAAQAAALRGKSKEAVDHLFAAKTSLSPFLFDKLGKKLGVEKGPWRAEMSTPEVRSLVARDVGEGHALGLAAIPAAYLDGRRIDQSRLTREVESVLER
ncbi:MAG: thioredoxin domain-containing protein [Planctomycetota bacterium]|nr:thioredoxin domain-containing protein [Planctomycetota bacterium]